MSILILGVVVELFVVYNISYGDVGLGIESSGIDN